MSFLDRFKPQPRWKHADPAVRAAAVPEIPDDPEHQAVIEELARGDEDVRVRREAIVRVANVARLADLARSERDDDLRREIAERLVAIATAPAGTDADAALAIDGLEDPKQLSAIAKSSPHDTVRAAALGRVHDVKALSSVARHAANPQTAADAVARVGDAAELLNVAMKTDHKDAGIAALEKCLGAGTPGGADERATLESVNARAKNKSVSRRARAMVQAIDEAEAARRLALEQHQQRVAAVLARVEMVAANPAVPTGDQLAAADVDWRELAASGSFELDPETAAGTAFWSRPPAPRSPHTSVNRRSGAPPPSATRRSRPRGSCCASGSKTPAARRRSTRSKRPAANGKGCRGRQARRSRKPA